VKAPVQSTVSLRSAKLFDKSRCSVEKSAEFLTSSKNRKKLLILGAGGMLSHAVPPPPIEIVAYTKRDSEWDKHGHDFTT
jgi:hypothetical protein